MVKTAACRFPPSSSASLATSLSMYVGAAAAPSRSVRWSWPTIALTTARPISLCWPIARNCGWRWRVCRRPTARCCCACPTTSPSQRLPASSAAAWASPKPSKRGPCSSSGRVCSSTSRRWSAPLPRRWPRRPRLVRHCWRGQQCRLVGVPAVARRVGCGHCDHLCTGKDGEAPNLLPQTSTDAHGAPANP